jgi:hypothetical protein
MHQLSATASLQRVELVRVGPAITPAVWSQVGEALAANRTLPLSVLVLSGNRYAHQRGRERERAIATHAHSGSQAHGVHVSVGLACFLRSYGPFSTEAG